MLLTLSTTHRPATDLGFLLRKNPARAQEFDLPFGRAHVFYPEATEESCVAALLVEVDPVGLVRGRRGPAGEGGALDSYVNDRPYAASSFLSVAIARVFDSRARRPLQGAAQPRRDAAPAARGNSRAAVPRRGGIPAPPLRAAGVSAERLPLDSQFPESGPGAAFGCGEGMVVKPLDFIARGRRGLVQPAVKCRGPEYLRIIYGPEYSAPPNLDRLRQRGLGAKRSLALREFALGVEGLERWVRREPLRRVHECAFGVLALESEPVDPRL